MADRFLSTVENFSDLFVSYRTDVTGTAQQYLNGLMQAGTRKNMERMAEVVPESNHQSLQQFLSDSRWDAQAVMNRVSQNANKLIGDKKEACLLIDESSFEKKGEKSVGVARQWLGRLGKVENGQVGVFATLCTGSSTTPIDARLYLPEVWINDRERCLAAKIPADKIVFKTKEELALEMVDNARQQSVQFGWVGADAGYGKGLGFCLQLEDKQETFVVDIHSTQHIFLENPEPYLPTQKGAGRKPTIFKTNEKGTRVDKWVAAQPDSSWRTIVLRKSTKGDLTYEFLTTGVWVWQKGTNTVRYWRLIVRRDPETHSDYKYSFSNVPSKTSTKRLAYMQSQRSWIERGFEDAKSECGMADYQLRGWVGWHHHMALVMMAMLFMCKERIIHKEDHPLLSCSDIETLLVFFLPRRDTTAEEVIRQMEFRHKQRQASIDSAARRKKQRKASG